MIAYFCQVRNILRCARNVAIVLDTLQLTVVVAQAVVVQTVPVAQVSIWRWRSLGFLRSLRLCVIFRV